MPTDMKVACVIILVLLAFCLIFAILRRMGRLIITIIILLLVIPPIFKVIWGDGRPYVSAVASIFTQQIEDSINRGYEAYYFRTQADPIIDMEQIEVYTDVVREKTVDSASNVFAEYFPSN